MKVMIVGSGGREHALAWKLSQSPLVSDILFVPGNGGMRQIGECVNADVADARAVAKIALEWGIDLTVVGPEAPLVAGIVDHFEERGLRAFGPSREAARLEGSKQFAKRILEDHGIPTGRAKVFDNFDDAREYVESQQTPLVVKADGLAAGKGVIIAKSAEVAVEALRDCLVENVFGESGAKVLIEEFMEGPEVSILSLSDGEAVAHMVPSQDHKRVFDGDQGPNTGGMGAYSPVPLLDAACEAAIHEQVMNGTVIAMRDEGVPYRGVLYGGLMLTSDGMKVLEFNARFGDPETQAVLPRMKSDLVPALRATIDGTVSSLEMDWSPEYCVCVVIASGGYPGKYSTGIPIRGLVAAATDSKVEIFHAGTALEDGEVVTSGGRVLNVVASGKDFAEARGLAYEAAERISFEGMHYRTDIGFRAL
ncbi:MAG: phosphoribosylamine--glycine ligase [Candidatus Anoxymicrobium japonicum]|uniref:Phosphoribosylamine--glycine ligase n=1 Tax=Candidatus Anoxymicrobium japonicum TaxID=2013648 RepID=A0A2N3G7T3_9ACTN|nr:MAG: phosphoribosylamine--glycine ligase [Candidatus Anoxymicrobium japonicum]